MNDMRSKSTKLSGFELTFGMASRNDRLLPWLLDNPDLVEENGFLQSITGKAPGAIVSLPKATHAEINVNGATAAVIVSVKVHSPFAAFAHIVNSDTPARFSKMPTRLQLTCVEMDVDEFNTVTTAEKGSFAALDPSASMPFDDSVNILRELGRRKALNVFLAIFAGDTLQVECLTPPFDPKLLNAAILCLKVDELNSDTVNFMGITDESTNPDDTHTMLTSNPIIQVLISTSFCSCCLSSFSFVSRFLPMLSCQRLCFLSGAADTQLGTVGSHHALLRQLAYQNALKSADKMKKRYDVDVRVRKFEVGDVVGVTVPKKDRNGLRSLLPLLVVEQKDEQFRLRSVMLFCMDASFFLTPVFFLRSPNFVLETMMTIEALVPIPSQSYPELVALRGADFSELPRIPLKTLARKPSEVAIKLSNDSLCGLCNGALGEVTHRCGFCGKLVTLKLLASPDSSLNRAADAFPDSVPVKRSSPGAM